MTVLCKSGLQSGLAAVHDIREKLESYITIHSAFSKCHTPFDPHESDPVLIQRMCNASRRVGVGPMAAVAGAVAEACLNRILATGVDEAVVDNGGDIALKIQKPVFIGLYSGCSLPNTLAFELQPRQGVLGICTSAGTVGHSFSYGRSDAATVFSENILLADAAATALGNRIKKERDLHTCFDFLEKLPEIEGALAVCNGKIALWGEIPKIVRCAYNPDLITRGRS